MKDKVTDLALERTALANERTLLAYIRTAMSVVAFGVLVLHFLGDSSSQFVGMSAIGVGTLIFGVGIWRYQGERSRLRGS